MRFVRQKINLRPFDADAVAWFTGAHPVAGSDDLCFITQHTPEQVVAHLQACQVRLDAGPVERACALGPMTSVYCRDPDGNLIEIAWYPPAGAARWPTASPTTMIWPQAIAWRRFRGRTRGNRGQGLPVVRVARSRT